MQNRPLFVFFSVILNWVLHMAPYILLLHESLTIKMLSTVYRCSKTYSCWKGYRQMTTICAGRDRKLWLSFFNIIAIGFDKHCSSSFSQKRIFSKALKPMSTFCAAKRNEVTVVQWYIWVPARKKSYRFCTQATQLINLCPLPHSVCGKTAHKWQNNESVIFLSRI